MLKMSHITFLFKKPKTSPLVKGPKDSLGMQKKNRRQWIREERIFIIALHVFQLWEIFDMISLENENKVYYSVLSMRQKIFH